MTKIEWTEATWNPMVGCSIVSPGCINCYAMRMAARIEAMNAATTAKAEGLPPANPRAQPSVPHYTGTTQRSKAGPVWTGRVALAGERTLLKPLRRKTPTMYFVNSMSDLFHEDVPDAWIDRVFAVMALCPQHTFQVLTKRAARMREYFSKERQHEAVDGTHIGIFPADRPKDWWFAATGLARFDANVNPTLGLFRWNGERWSFPPLPLPNVWLGVSAERQKEADERIPDLLATPAAVRFVSAEPLLGPIDFTRIKLSLPSTGSLINDERDALAGIRRYREDGDSWKRERAEKIDWIIVGGESGPGARPMHPDWPRSIRDQCAAADVPFFFKQWGDHEPTVAAEHFADYLTTEDDRPLLRDAAKRQQIVWPDGRRVIPRASVTWWEQQDLDSDGDPTELSGCPVMMRSVGKARAGRVLDGISHGAMPTTTQREVA